MMTSPPVPQRPTTKPLPWLLMVYLPWLLWLWRGSARERIERRMIYTYDLWQRHKQDQIERRQKLHEAKIYERLLVSAWTRLGGYYAYRWRNDPAPDGGPKKRRKVQRVLFERIYIGDDFIWFKVLARRRTLFGWHKDALPHKVRVQDLISDESIYELALTLERVISVINEDPRKGVWVRVHRLEGVGGLPTRCTHKELLASYPQDMSKAYLVLGMGEHKKVHYASLATHPHVLIGGSSGGGKSNLVNHIICSLARFTDANELKLVLIDLKRLEFAFYETLPHLFCPIIFDADEAVEMLEELVGEVQQRSKIMANRAKELSAWNKKYPNKAMPRIVVIIDEFAELMLASGRTVAAQVETLVTRIANLGRAVGVHLIICTQRPAVQVVPNPVKINMPLVISARTQNAVQSNTILGNGAAATLPMVPGRMLYLSGSQMTMIQTPLVTDDDVIEAVRIARGKAAQVIVLKGIEPEINPDGLLRFILDNFDGQLSPSKLHEVLVEYGISMNRLKAFLADIITKQEITVGQVTYRVGKKGNSYQLGIIHVEPKPYAEPRPALLQLPPPRDMPPAPPPPEPAPEPAPDIPEITIITPPERIWREEDQRRALDAMREIRKKKHPIR